MNSYLFYPLKRKKNSNNSSLKIIHFFVSLQDDISGEVILVDDGSSDTTISLIQSTLMDLGCTFDDITHFVDGTIGNGNDTSDDEKDETKAVEKIPKSSTSFKKAWKVKKIPR